MQGTHAESDPSTWTSIAGAWFSCMCTGTGAVTWELGAPDSLRVEFYSFLDASVASLVIYKVT